MDMATETFWDRISPEKLDAVINGETEAFETVQRKVRVRKDRPKVQAPPPVEPQPVTVAAGDARQLTFYGVFKTVVVALLGAAALAYVQHVMPQPAARAQETVAQAPHQDHTKATPEPPKEAQEPTTATPEPAAAPEPAVPVNTSEPVPDRTYVPNGAFLEWAAAGDIGTLYKDGKDKIDLRADRFVGDPQVIARMIRETKGRVVKGTAMWAEKRPDGAVDVYTCSNVREDVYGDQTAFRMHQPLVQCRQGISRIASDGRFVPADELKIPREMWYRSGASSARQ
jgi:hypothetical protein